MDGFIDFVSKFDRLRGKKVFMELELKFCFDLSDLFEKFSQEQDQN